MRRAALVIAFVAVLLLVVVGGHAYLTDKLAVAPDLPPGLRGLLVLIIGGGALALMMQPLAERAAPPRVARLIAWPASLWMGTAFFLLLGFLATDLVRALVDAAFAATSEAGGVTPAAARIGTARLQAVLVVGLAFSAVARGIYEQRGGPRVTRHEVRLARWPRALDGFRIVQISDIHIGPILDRRFAAAVTAQVNALAPDLIAITGDLVDGDARRLRAEVAPFGELRAPHGVWVVTGNHDYFSGVDAWVANVRRLGIRPLRNQRVTIEHNGAAFDLAGVEDHHAYMVHPTEKSDVVRALADRDPDRAVVLLAHDPLTFKTAARCGVDLQLSGHTHGGQIWPFKYLVRISTPFVAGHYRRGDAQLFVHRGTGFWGPAMRLFAPAEIAEITIRSTESAAA
ncbi:MAG: metallophosphoesterase [Deltaproteobacteria bacterium]|nr:metallophosphoesterase [Deltaproteobacteria bacterium]